MTEMLLLSEGGWREHPVHIAVDSKTEVEGSRKNRVEIYF